MAKKVKRRAWSSADVRTLRRLAAKRTPVARIARSLRRSEGATRQKALTLTVSLDSRTTKPKTALKKAAPKKKTALKKTAAKKTAAKKMA